MGYGDRWRRAVEAAKGVVQQMHGADRAVVVYFDGTASAAGDLTHDKSALLAAIDSVRPTAGATRYDAVIRMVQHVFGDTAQPRRQLVLISDYQRSGWSERELPSLPPGTTLTQINLGGGATSNVVVTNVDVYYDTSAGHERVNLQARIANRSAKPLQKHTVTFELNGHPAQTQLVDCAANGVATVAFDPVPVPPGISRGTVRSGPDSLEADNSFYFTIDPEPSLQVLLVQPQGADAKAGTFLSLALGISQHLSFRVRTVRAGQLSAADLRKTTLVVLNGAPVPGGDLGRRLVDYVQSGGGLVVALGGESHPDAWPALADPLLPRPSTRIVDRMGDRGATLEFIDHGHAVFEPFSASHSGDFSAARFSRYWAIKPGVGDRQLARFDDGHVALLERRVGAGRVLVWSSDVDGVWNDLPLQPVFLPLMQQMAKYAAGYEREQSWATVGDMLTLPTLFGDNPLRADSTGARQTAGGAQYVAISPSRAQTRFNAATSGLPASLELSEQGFYDVRRTGGAGDSARTVAVNVDVAESDMTPLDTGLFAATVSPRAGASGKARTLEELVPSDMEHRQNLWWYLLAVALLLLAAETLLSNRLSRVAH
jgi:hypothetical protein